MVDVSLPGARAPGEIDAIIAARGNPLTIVNDNATELIRMAICKWTQDGSIQWRYFAPG
jgi:hypothetical protein